MADGSAHDLQYCCRPLLKTFKLHEQSWYVDNMEAVRDWLKAAVPDALTPRPEVEQDKALQVLWQESPKECSHFLAKLSSALQRTLDILFGKEAPAEQKARMTKFPARTFLDFKGAGGLCLIMRSTLRLRTRMAWPFSSLENKIVSAAEGTDQDFQTSDWVSFFVTMERELAENKIFARPVVIFSPEVMPPCLPIERKSPDVYYHDKVLGKILNRLCVEQWDRQDKLMEKMNLSSIIKRHKGVIVPMHDSRATHIIVPDPSPSAEEKVVELSGKYHMVVEEQPAVSLVHWWYYPDSYDDWLPKTAFPEESARRFPQNGFAWRVRAKWVSDSTTFNEWMNELDYEVPEPVPVRPAAPMSVPVQAVVTPKSQDVAESKIEYKQETNFFSRKPSTGGMSADEASEKAYQEGPDPGILMLGKEKSRKYKGVYFDTKKEVWLAHCYVPSQGKRFIGDFKSEEEAARAYDRAALQNLGHKRANINFKREDYTDLLQELRERDIKLGKDPDRHMGIGELAQQIKRHKKLVKQGVLTNTGDTQGISEPVSSPLSSQAKPPAVTKLPTQIPAQTASQPATAATYSVGGHPMVQPIFQQSQPHGQPNYQPVQPSFVAKQPILQQASQPPVPGFQALAPQIQTAVSTGPIFSGQASVGTFPKQPAAASHIPVAMHSHSAPSTTSAASHESSSPLPCPSHTCAARMFSSKAQALKDTDFEHWRTEPFVIPSYASWFQLGKIHPIELRAMPALFESETNCNLYLSVRDKIINLYRDYPHKVLLASDCFRHVAGDAGTVLRIHAFLDQWGLINFEADGRMRFAKIMWAIKSPQIPNLVCAVTGAPIERVRYTSHKAPDIHLSPTAYVAGLFPPNMCANDFVRTVSVDFHPTSLPSYGDWTEEETFRLLEALDRFGDDWDMVAQYVGSKSIEQCAVHFARLPIFDRYIEDVCPTSWSRQDKEMSQAFPDHPKFSNLAKVISAFLSASDDSALPAAVDAARAVLEGQSKKDVPESSAEDLDVDCGLPFYSAIERPYPSNFCNWASAAAWADAVSWHQASESSLQMCHKGALVITTIWTPKGPMPRRACITGGSNEFGLFEIRICCQASPWCPGTLRRCADEMRVLSADEVKAVEKVLGGHFMRLHPSDVDDDESDLPSQSVTDVSTLPPLSEGNAAANPQRGEACAERDALAGDDQWRDGGDMSLGSTESAPPGPKGGSSAEGSGGHSRKGGGTSAAELAVKERLATAMMRLDRFDQLSGAVRELRTDGKKRPRGQA